MAETASLSGASPVSRVRALASRMRELCLRLDGCSVSIGARVHDEDPGVLVGLLAEREPLVGELARLGDELGAILDDPASARVLGEQEHAQIRERLGQLEQVMAKIRERDREARGGLSKRRDRLADELASVSNARGAIRAYSGAGRPANPTVQDSRG